MTDSDLKLLSYNDLFNLKSRGQKKFLYVKDIKFTLKHNKLDSKGKKDVLLIRLKEHFKNLERYTKHINKIIKLQSKVKEKQIKNKILLQGPGIQDKSICNNDEDFYTGEHKDEISNDYFFSYKDADGFIYYFDIRSFRKLVEGDYEKLNPYTRNPIPDYVISNMNKRLEQLKKRNIEGVYKKEKLTTEQLFNERVISIFQKIDSLNTFAGGTDVNWFHSLNFIQLKNLYKVLEDIWNYRSELTESQKRDIVPLNNVFKISMGKVMSLKQQFKRKLQNIILDDIDRLVSSSDSQVHRSTGSYYVLIALVEVSSECANQMPWLIQIS